MKVPENEIRLTKERRPVFFRAIARGCDLTRFKEFWKVFGRFYENYQVTIISTTDTRMSSIFGNPERVCFDGKDSWISQDRQWYLAQPGHRSRSNPSLKASSFKNIVTKHLASPWQNSCDDIEDYLDTDRGIEFENKDAQNGKGATLMENVELSVMTELSGLISALVGVRAASVSSRIAAGVRHE